VRRRRHCSRCSTKDAVLSAAHETGETLRSPTLEGSSPFGSSLLAPRVRLPLLDASALSAVDALCAPLLASAASRQVRASAVQFRTSAVSRLGSFPPRQFPPRQFRASAVSRLGSSGRSSQPILMSMLPPYVCHTSDILTNILTPCTPHLWRRPLPAHPSVCSFFGQSSPLPHTPRHDTPLHTHRGVI
jgi:hypothetical protein